MKKKKVILVKLTERTGKIASNARGSSTPESRAKSKAFSKALRIDKLKRIREYRTWWS